MFADSATAAWTLAYDIPPSIAAKSSPHRNNHDAAFASRAKASGFAISPRLNLRSAGLWKSATTTNLPPAEPGGHYFESKSCCEQELLPPAMARNWHLVPVTEQEGANLQGFRVSDR